MSAAEEPQSLEPEDAARALWYGLLSRLFYAPPDRALLDALAGAVAPDEEASGALVDAWRALQLASRAADLDAAREEFDALFIGVGKALVTPYTSAYVAAQAPDRHLLEIRSTLGEWGLGRREQVFEAEDHVSALCDAMRWLIDQRRTLEAQRAFFDRYVRDAVPLYCDAIKRVPLGSFYRAAGDFARAFVAIEREAFDMHTPA